MSVCSVHNRALVEKPNDSYRSEAENDAVNTLLSLAEMANAANATTGISSSLKGRVTHSPQRNESEQLVLVNGDTDNTPNPWTDEKVSRLEELVKPYTVNDKKPKWDEIAKSFPNHTKGSCHKKAIRESFYVVSKKNKRDPWTDEEVSRLEGLVKAYTDKKEQPNWAGIAGYFKNHTKKSCRSKAVRETFYVVPKEHRHNLWIDEEVSQLKSLVKAYTDKKKQLNWVEIAKHFTNHTLESCRKKAVRKGII